MKAVGERFGRAVRQSREALGWSQEMLAGRADLNRTYVGDIERGASVPTILTAAKLAFALELSLSTLVERFENAGVDTGRCARPPGRLAPGPTADASNGRVPAA